MNTLLGTFSLMRSSINISGITKHSSTHRCPQYYTYMYWYDLRSEYYMYQRSVTSWKNFEKLTTLKQIDELL